MLLEGVKYFIELFARCSLSKNMVLEEWLSSGVLGQVVKLLEECVYLKWATDCLQEEVYSVYVLYCTCPCILKCS